MDLLVLPAMFFYLISGERASAHKKEKPCIDTQRNEVNDSLMDLISIRWISEVTNVCSFLRAFLKNEL